MVSRCGRPGRFIRLASVKWLVTMPAALLAAAAFAAPAAASLASPAQTPSRTITWVGAKSTAWELAGNWSPARVPSTHDWACIPAGTTRKPVARMPSAGSPTAAS
jgi:hypothetical protein